jgi:hypothetical protein
MGFMSINTHLSKFLYWKVREHSFVMNVPTPLSLAPSSRGTIWILQAFQNMNWMASLFFQNISNLVRILNFLLNHYKWSWIKCVPFVGQTLLWFLTHEQFHFFLENLWLFSQLFSVCFYITQSVVDLHIMHAFYMAHM